MSYSDIIIALKGGSGSGNFGHAGRPGKRGGSSTGKGGALLSSEEESAIREYTWLMSQTINDELAEGKVSTSRPLGVSNQDIVDRLDSVINKSPIINQAMTLHAKFDAANLLRTGNLKLGHVINRLGYTSASTLPDGTTSSPSRRYANEAVMDINVPEGYKGVVDISQLSKYPQEKEWLFKRGIKLRIDSIKEPDNSYIDPYRISVTLVD